jgi:hypothetical protein
MRLRSVCETKIRIHLGYVVCSSLALTFFLKEEIAQDACLLYFSGEHKIYDLMMRIVAVIPVICAYGIIDNLNIEPKAL